MNVSSAKDQEQRHCAGEDVDSLFPLNDCHVANLQEVFA